MPNPTPVYKVTYNGTDLLGYAVDEDVPLALRVGTAPIVGRDGGAMLLNGADFRTFKISMRILSRLGVNSTGLQHVNDCKAQWRANLAALTRSPGPKALYIGETDRYIMSQFESSSAPFTAGNSRAISFDLNFTGNPPWFLGTTVSSITAVSGNTSVNVTIGDTRKTYPVIEVEDGIDHIKFAHGATGKSLTLSGVHANPIIVDCGTLQITSNGVNSLSYLTSTPDFGIYQIGAGTLTLVVTEVVGSGNVTLSMTPRYER